MRQFRQVLYMIIVVAISGCATLPTGPSVAVLPPQGKPFAQFQAEDANCRKWAEQSVGISSTEAHNESVVSGAVVGSVIGAGAGALLGSASGHAGTGAAIGAGTGLLMGSAIGSDAGRVYGQKAQRRYDIVYSQCMVANGNQITYPAYERVPGYYYRGRRILTVPTDIPAVYYYPPTSGYYTPTPPAQTYYPPPYPPPNTPPPDK